MTVKKRLAVVVESLILLALVVDLVVRTPAHHRSGDLTAHLLGVGALIVAMIAALILTLRPRAHTRVRSRARESPTRATATPRRSAAEIYPVGADGEPLRPAEPKPYPEWFNGSSGGGMGAGPSTPFGGLGGGIWVTLTAVAIPVAALWGALHRAEGAASISTSAWVVGGVAIVALSAAILWFGLVLVRVAVAQLRWARKHRVRFRGAAAEIVIYVAGVPLLAAVFGLIWLGAHLA